MASCALTMSLSPGPVNRVLIASSARYGVWGALPFLSGACLGCISLLVLLTLGMHRYLSLYPGLLRYLVVAGYLFIAYTGYAIATSPSYQEH